MKDVLKIAVVLLYNLIILGGTFYFVCYKEMSWWLFAIALLFMATYKSTDD